MSRPVLIGIGGGTGSGKTLFAKNIVNHFNAKRVAVVGMDAYYKNLDYLPMDARNQRNFDHPEAFDWPLLQHQVREFLSGNPLEIPIYDYRTHTRTTESRPLGEVTVALLEGILALSDPELRDEMDLRIFVDVPADIRFIRRLQRDIRDRGRTVDSVVQQYQSTVRPMHEQYVEPTKVAADLIVPGGGQNTVAVDTIRSRIAELLGD
ncbi:MAG TPA: uridine kinase [bacterium]|nr:uridine kinase [bacterium]